MDPRSLFPVFDRFTYLEWASVGPAPTTSVDSISKFASGVSSMSLEASFSEYVFNAEQKSRELLARLINSKPDEISFTGSSTTEGVQTFLNSLNPGKGSNIVSTDLEFPLMATELQKWKERKVEIRVWKHRSGSFSHEDLESLVDDDTAAVCLSSVIWVNGFRFDLKEVAKIAHEREAFVLADSIQHAGAVNLDVADSGVDAVSGGAHKWLMSPFGTGFLYISSRITDRLQRVSYGYGNMETPASGWEEYWIDRQKVIFSDYRFSNDFRKYQYGGMKNYAGLIGLSESLKILESVPQDERDSRILSLRRTFLETLETHGYFLVSPVDEEHSSGIVTFTTGSLDADRRLHARLLESGIRVSLRGAGGIGGIRVAFNFLNNEEDIAKLVSMLER